MLNSVITFPKMAPNPNSNYKCCTLNPKTPQAPKRTIGLGFSRVWGIGLGFRVWGLGFEVQGFRFKDQRAARLEVRRTWHPALRREAAASLHGGPVEGAEFFFCVCLCCVLLLLLLVLLLLDLCCF